jgi:hypothetical protein
VEDRALSSSAWAFALAAGGAAHAVVVVAPALATHAFPGAAWLAASLLGPAMLAYGLLRRSGPALLVGVPAGWVLPAHWLPAAAPDPALAVAALGVVACYVPAACWWAGPLPVARPVEWAALDGAAVPPTRDPVPWVAGLLVAGPAAGVACWPPLAEAATRGFPSLPGLALVGCALVGTLVGLAMVTDLFRGRAAVRGSRRRAGVLSGLTVVLLLLLALVRG